MHGVKDGLSAEGQAQKWGQKNKDAKTRIPGKIMGAKSRETCTTLNAHWDHERLTFQLMESYPVPFMILPQ